MKELGNLRTVLDAQTDKGKDTEGGRKTAVIFEHDTLFRSQEGIELLNKVREELQKGGIEILIQLAHVGLASLHLLQQLVEFSSLHQFHYSLAHGLYLVDIDGTKAQESTNIYFLHLVTLVERMVHLVKTLICQLQGMVGFLQLMMGRSNALALLVDIVEQEHNHKEKHGRTRYHEPQMLVARRKFFLIFLLNMREYRHDLAAAARRIENGSRLPGKLDILVRALLLARFGIEQIGEFPERPLVHHSQLDIADSRTQKAAEKLLFIAKLIVGQAAIKLYNGILMGARFRHRQPLIAQSQSLLHIACIACPHLLHLQIKVIIMAECAVYCSLIGITLACIIFLQRGNVGIICHLAIQMLASPEVVAFALSIKISDIDRLQQVVRFGIIARGRFLESKQRLGIFHLLFITHSEGKFHTSVDIFQRHVVLVGAVFLKERKTGIILTA